jgi:hypothetical protein
MDHDIRRRQGWGTRGPRSHVIEHGLTANCLTTKRAQLGRVRCSTLLHVRHDRTGGHGERH